MTIEDGWIFYIQKSKGGDIGCQNGDKLIAIPAHTPFRLSLMCPSLPSSLMLFCTFCPLFCNSCILVNPT